MVVIVEVREDAFRTPKTPQQIAQEIQQAVAVFWVARGDIAPEAAREIIAPPSSEREKEGALMDLLMRMPNVGADADFERPADIGRPVVEFD